MHRLETIEGENDEPTDSDKDNSQSSLGGPHRDSQKILSRIILPIIILPEKKRSVRVCGNRFEAEQSSIFHRDQDVTVVTDRDPSFDGNRRQRSDPPVGTIDRIDRNQKRRILLKVGMSTGEDRIVVDHKAGEPTIDGVLPKRIRHLAAAANPAGRFRCR